MIMYLQRLGLSRERLVLGGALAALIFSRAIDQAIFYRLNFSFVAYVWYLASIILSVAFLCLSWPVVWYKMYFTNDITDEMRACPQYKFAIMGLLDTLFNLFSTFPIAHLGGDTSNVLSQTVLPINMLFAYIFLKTRYKKNHYLGALLIVYGVLVALVFRDDSRFTGSFMWVAILILSQMPAAASNIYKEVGLKKYELDVWYANSWIALWQLGFGILTVWTVTIKEFVGPYSVPLDRVIDYIADANRCFFGEVVKDSISGHVHEYCVDTPFYTFLFFIAFNITYNMLMLYIFKKGSSVLFVIASAVRLPLVDLLILVPWIAGQAVERFGLNDVFALFILIIALVIYYSEPEDNSAIEREKLSSLSADDDLGQPLAAPVSDMA